MATASEPSVHPDQVHQTNRILAFLHGRPFVRHDWKSNTVKVLSSYGNQAAQVLPSASLSNQPKTEKKWLIWVSILTFPSFVFFLVYTLFVMIGTTTIIGMGPALALAVPGLFGASMTFASLMVAVYAAVHASISTRLEKVMWWAVALSLAGWLYVWISFSILLQVPPSLPF
jgi:hypothetical protein